MENSLLISLLILIFILLLWKLFFDSKNKKYLQIEQKLQEKTLECMRMEEKIEYLEKGNESQNAQKQLYIEKLEIELNESREKLGDAEKSLVSLQSYLESQEQILKQQKGEVVELRQHFYNEFKVLANQIFEEKSKKFVENNALNLEQILNPLQERIKTFEKKVDQTYSHEAAERNALKGVVELLLEQSKSIQSDANNLTKALKGDNKKQGNWGEVVLERVLERSGLRKNEEYKLQANFKDEDGKRQIPDAIILLPENKHLIVDSKVSLTAYNAWVNEDNDALKNSFAKEHVVSIQSHVKSLSSKNYANLAEMDTPDFVLLFMPIESAFSLALSLNPDLFSEAWDKKVVLVSPTTLLATLRTVASIWKQERQNRYALEIAKEAGALYDKFDGFLKDMEKVANQLQSANKSHYEGLRKLSEGPGNIIRRIENLKELGAKATKQIDSKYLD